MAAIKFGNFKASKETLTPLQKATVAQHHTSQTAQYTELVSEKQDVNRNLTVEPSVVHFFAELPGSC